jgi:hypothetical protein
MTRRDVASYEEPQEGKEEGGADQPSEKPMPVFPPEDQLELVEAHALVDELILGCELILLERLLPLRVRHRRQRADDRLPFDDRQARMR